VRKTHAESEPFAPGIVFDVRVDPIGSHGPIQGELSFGGKPDNYLGGDGLGEGGNVIERLFVGGRSTWDLLAVVCGPRDLAVFNISD
jgi:hypothetical protein